MLSQLCESIAVATQTLLARAMGTLRQISSDQIALEQMARSRREAWHVIRFVEKTLSKPQATTSASALTHVFRLGAAVGTIIAAGLTTLTALNPAKVIAGLTTDIAVREACAGIMTPVLICQLFKGLAFPANGVVMGGLDWGFATCGIRIGSLLCVGLVHLNSPPTLATVWIGLAAFMASQTILSAARIASRSGPWAMLYTQKAPRDSRLNPDR